MKRYDSNRRFTVFNFFFGFVFLSILVIGGVQAYAIYFGVKAVGRGDAICVDDHCIHYRPAQ